MAETVTEETVETTATTETQTTAQTQTQATEEFDKDRAMKTIEKLREIEKQAKKDKAELDRLKQEEQKRKDAELSEADRLKKELAQTQASLEAARLKELQRSVSDEVGLPAVFATRVQGADREAMLADAKALLAAIPKGATAQPGNATSV